MASFPEEYAVYFLFYSRGLLSLTFESLLKRISLIMILLVLRIRADDVRSDNKILQ
jgi:hypothetical protein